MESSGSSSSCSSATTATAQHTSSHSQLLPTQEQEQQQQRGTNQHATRKQGTIIAGYEIHDKLGHGSFATVYRAKRKRPSLDHDSLQKVHTVNNESWPETLAIKAISKRLTHTPKILANLDQEISILSRLTSPAIVQLHHVERLSDKKIYLFMEFCAGGDLQQLIRSRKAGRLSERLCRRLMRDLSGGIGFLYGQQLIHRDIKPQNLLLSTPLPLIDASYDPPLETHANPTIQDDSNTAFHLKIADFGFSRPLSHTSLAATLCGSPLYMAPEILQHQRYDYKCDLWSVGTVLFEMVTGKPPFGGSNHMELLRNIMRKAVRLPGFLTPCGVDQGGEDNAKTKISQECVTLLKLLLHRNPMRRGTMEQFLECCDKFVALGCLGEAMVSNNKVDLNSKTNHYNHPRIIPEVCNSSIPEEEEAPRQDIHVVTPNLHPLPTSTAAATVHVVNNNAAPAFAPLIASPSLMSNGNGTHRMPAAMPPPFALDNHTLPAAHAHAVLSHTHSLKISNNHTAPATAPMSIRRNVSIISNTAVNNTNAAAVNEEFVMVPRSSMEEEATISMSSSPSNNPTISTARTSTAVRNHNNYTATNTLALAEDIGRRAVTIAHVGDTRAYIAMRLMINQSSSFDENRSAAVSMDVDPPFACDVMQHVDATAITTCLDDAMDEDVLPFAANVNAKESPILSSGSSGGIWNANDPQQSNQPSNSYTKNVLLIQHFKEALGCYLKALKFMRRALSTAHHIYQQQQTAKQHGNSSTSERCKVSLEWLTQQFQNILNRADAANAQVSRLKQNMSEEKNCDNNEMVNQSSSICSSSFNQKVVITSVEEQIYHHAMACGKDGTVKQILKQNDAALQSYKSAKLLIEALLMEPPASASSSLPSSCNATLYHNTEKNLAVRGSIPRIGGTDGGNSKWPEEDRKVLESYLQCLQERMVECSLKQQ